MEFLSDLWLGIINAFRGIPMTLAVSAIAVAAGLLLGFVVAFLRKSKFKVLRAIAMVYVDVLRGTPLVVQALIMAYGVPVLLQQQGVDFKWPYLTIPATIVCSLNSAAYMGEIVRGGLEAVSKGQREAAASLGMTQRQANRLIVIPQAVRIILPPLGNEFITMIKETAVLSWVGVVETMRMGTLLASRSFDTFTAYGGVAIVYLIFTIPLSKLVLYLEKRMKLQ